jgi:gliding motility-associated-like protein
MKTFIKKVFVTVFSIVLFLAFVPAMAQYTKSTLNTGSLYTALAKDAAGNVYVTKGAGNGTFHVAKYTNGTGTPTIIYSGLTFEVADLPWGLAIAPNGDVYVGTDFTSNAGAIFRLDAANSYAATKVQSGRYFTGLTFDAAGALYALEYNVGANDYAVCKYTAPATVNSAKTMLYHGFVVAPNVSYPNGLAISSSGDIYVTKPRSTDGSNTYTGGILKLNAPSYGTTTSIATGTNTTTLVLDDFGNLYAADEVGTKIYALKKYTGGTGTPTTFYSGLNGAGSFLPYGVTFVGTTGYIADGDNGTGGELIKLVPTDVTPPAVPTGLTVTAATGQNTLTWNANAETDLLGYKIYGGTTASPTTLIASIPKGTTTFTNTGLTNGTTYYYSISSEDTYFNESAKTADATGKPLPAATAPTATTGGNTPSYITAALAGTVNDNNATTTVTFDWGLTTSYGSSVNGTPNSITAGTGSTAVTGSLTGLTPGTVYHYRVKAVNSVTTTNGTDGTFTTLSLPTVTTAVPGTITTTSAVLGGNVTAAGSSAVSERGIVYSLTTNPTVANTKVQNGTGIGVFSATVSSFASNTLYYVKAYAINGGGPSYGAEQTFTTASSTITAGSTFPAGLTTTYGVTSSSTSIAVSGTNISAGITATPSSTANFEVSADDITYGPSATIGSSGTVSGTVYVRLKSTAAANASITGSVTLTSTGSNSPVITIPTSSVAKATLTYTADLKSKIYGAAIPTLTGTVSGFVNSETVAVTTGTLSFTTSATVSSSVGSFAINGTGLTAANYSFVQAAGNASALTITPKTLTVTASGNNKAYDGTTAATVTLSDNRVTGDVFTESYASASFATATAGTAKPVSVSGISITGGASANYTLGNTTAATTADITARALTVTASGNNKAYDGTTAATVTLSDNRVTGDVFTESYASASFATATAGTAKPVSVSGISITGGASANYTLGNTTAATTADITARVLTVTASGNNKAYDGTTAATVTLSDNRITGDVFTESYTSATFATATAGTAKPVSVSGISITGGASANYTLGNTTAATTADITARALTVTASGNNKAYDGTTAATVTLSDNRVTGDVFTESYASASFATATAGTAKPVSVSGISITGGASANYTLGNTTAATTADITARALTVTANGNNKAYDGTTAATVTLSDNRVTGDVFTESYTSATFATATAGTAKLVSVSGISITGGASANYTLGNTTAATTADITARALTVTASGNNKAYDGTTAATVTLSDNRVTGDVFTESYTSATFATATAGTAKLVSVSGISITGGASANYTLGNTTAATTADITARALTVTASGNNKAYDGTTAATVTLSDNRITGDVFTESYTSATFATATAGTAKPVSVSGISITGGASANYTLGNTTAATTADITARALTVTASGNNKAYDGTTAATVTLSDNRVTGDVFTESYASASFATATAGTAKPVSVSGISITGGASANYTLGNTTAATTADITARALTVTANGNNKAYDGTTAATVTLSDNRVTGDVFTESYTSATFATATAGTAKPVSVSGISITGGASANYTLGNTTAATTADITARALTVTASGNNKAYDGTTAATVTLSDNRVTGDVFTESYASASFATATAGTAKPVSVSGISITGGASANYTLGNTTAATTADITARALTVTANGNNKAYDGTTAATVTLSDNRVTGDVFTESYTSATFATATAGTAKPVSVSGISIIGGASANYTLGNTTAATTADITARALTVTASGNNKAYDGTTAATVTLSDNRVTGDVFTESYASASFATATIGTAKPVSVSGISITGGASANYTLGNTTAATTADITASAIVITADAKSKVYGSADPALTYTYTGTLVGTDAFSGSLTRVAGNNVGTYAINQGTLVLSNASNYNITYNSANLSITPKTLTVTATGNNKVYDGTTAATVTLSDDRVAGDVFTESYASAGFATATVGTNKPVSVAGIAITGGASANYTLGNTTAATTADITARAIVVTAVVKNKVYGSADQALTYTYTGTLIGADAFTGSLTRVAGENVGAYAINQGTLALGSNYSLTYNSANLNITPKTLTVTAAGINKAYDGTTAATVNLSDNRVTGDVFTESYASASFATATIGTNKPVSVTGIAITGGASGNYTLGNTTAATTADITASAIVITADAKSKVYGSADPALTYTYTGTLVGTDAFTGSLTRVAGNNVGAYAINQGTLVLSNASNYNITYNSANLSITPKTLTVTATGNNKVYDGATAATVTLSDDRVAGDVFTESYASAGFATATVGTNKPVSVAGIAITGGASANYTLGNTTTATTADITARAIVVTAVVKNKVYGSADPAFTYTYTGTLIGTDAFTGSLTRVAGENVGAYAINQGTLALGSNYSLTYNSANLNITPKTLTVTAAGINKAYDGTTAATVNLSDNRVTGDVFTESYASATFATATVGTNKPVSVTGIAITGGASGNYTLGNTTAATTADITARAIVVTVDAKSKIYGSADPALTYTYTGTLVGTDAFTGSLTRVAGNNVGAYAINQGTLVLSNASNYSITYNNANLTITPKTLTVTAAGINKVYDGTTAATVTLSDDRVAGDVFTESYVSAAFATATAGTNKPVSVTGIAITGGASANYTLGNTTAATTADITARAIVITADAKSKTYGDADPAFTYTYAGTLIGTDTFTGSLTRAPGENIGTYAVNQGTLALSGNYSITFNSANLIIGKKTVTVTAAAKSKTYGDADPALTYTFAPALVTGDSFSGNLTRTTGENIGTYAINQGTLALNPNYTLTYVGADLTIGKKTVTVTAVAKSKTFGDADPALTYTFAPALVTGDTFIGNLTRVVGENVGTYAINQGTLALNANYTLTYIGANLTIGAKTITVTAVAKSKTYGDADPALTYTFAPALQTGDSFSGGLTRAAGENAGTYTINQGTLALNGNYSITYAGANLTINKAVLTVTASNAVMCQSDGFPTFAVTYSGFKVGDTESSLTAKPTVSTTANRNVAGTYALVPANGVANNYSFVYVNGTLTINALPSANIVSNKGTEISKGETAILTASGGTSYSWSTASGIISGQNTAILTVRPAQTTTYTVRVTNASGCSSVASITIKVNEDYKIVANNILTPNGDGVNDTWIVQNIDMYPSNEVRIFDRNGRLMYNKKGYDNSWNGTIGGNELAEGTYYYIITYGPDKLVQKGFITIIINR